jgi:RecB family exonuclease
LASILAEAVAAGEGAPSSSDASELAEARVDILGQVDPEQATGRPNPWFGFVGGVFPTEEAGPSVTGIERTAECPWAAFVGRRLGVAPTPDPQLGLPDPKGRLVGEVVHRVLEDIVRDTVPHESAGDVREIGSRNTCDVPWPAAARFEEILARNSGEVAAEAGLGPLGMGSLLAARSRPYLAVARDFDWHGGGRLAGVLATEASGVAFFSDTEPPLRFRADRVDRESDGLCLVDYKTGKPVSTLLKVETRRRHLLKEVQKGRMLQAAAYARALPEGEARGRYVWLKPDIGEAPEEAREAVVSGTDTDFMAAAAAAVAAVNSSREAGVVFPRVEEVGSDDIPNHCKYCAVAEACRRDDSGFRRRLVAWMAHAGPVAPPAETAARVLWHLGSPVEGDS